MLAEENYISYLSRGESKFVCSFKINFPQELEVYIENQKAVLGSDYLVQDLDKTTKTIEFFYAVGEFLKPKTVMLKRVVNMKRKTDFQNFTQIKPELLNLELDNFLENQIFLQANLNKTIKLGANMVDELFLPSCGPGKALIWKDNGSLINSEANIDDRFNDLENKVRSLQADYNAFVTGPQGEINGTNENGINENDEQINLIISAAEINYQGIVPAKNIQEAIDYVYNTNNANGDILQENLTILTSFTASLEAKNIKYNNQDTSFTSGGTIQEAIESLNAKVQNSAQIAGLPLAQDLSSPHCILKGPLDSDGLAGHLVYEGPFKLKIEATTENPLLISFTYNYLSLKIALTTRTTLSFPPIADKVYYIYADLKDNQKIQVGFTNNRPFYVYHYPNFYANSNAMLIDKYTQPSDYFYIPSLSMFDFNNNNIKRVYIGQVKFNSAGQSTYLNNYVHGNCFCYDIPLSPNTKFTLTNRIGHQAVSMSTYFKYNIVYTEDTSYNYLDSIKENTNELKAGLSLNISDQLISGVTPTPSVHCSFQKNALTPLYANTGYLRLTLKRVF
ncbi:hypothetical protein ABSA28_00962 [Candidatus Hepatincolaceae symbiont of Richtersius coronifer]